MKAKRYTALGIIIMGTLLLSGCGGNKTSNDTSESGKSGSVASAPINLMTQTEIGSLDTIFTQDEASINAQSAIFEGLYQLDAEDNIIPAGAVELPEISEDGKTYTIKLREDAKWSNGDPVTANDYVFAWRKLANPANQANYLFLIDGTVKNGTQIVNGEMSPDELGIVALDDYTLEITLEKPVAYFTSMLTFSPFFPQNEEYVTEAGSTYGTTSEDIVTNGQFIMKNWNQSSMNWDFEQNPDYHSVEDIKPEAIHFEVIKEANTAYNLFDSGELDIAPLSGDLAVNNKENPNYQSVQKSKIYYLKLNQLRNNEDSIFANENVRKAIAYALDKDALANQIVADGSEAVYGYIPENFVSNPVTGEDFRAEAGNLAETDAAKAKEYLAKAEAEIDGKVEIELLSKDGDNDKRIAEFIQGQLEETLPGLKINIKTVPQQNTIDLTKKGDYELAVGTWGPDYQDPMTFLENLKSGNNSGYDNPEYDKLLDEASNKYANDPEKRWEALIAAEKIMVEDDAAVIPLFQLSTGQLVSENLTGFQTHSFGPTETYTYLEKTE